MTITNYIPFLFKSGAAHFYLDALVVTTLLRAAKILRPAQDMASSLQSLPEYVAWVKKESSKVKDGSGVVKVVMGNEAGDTDSSVERKMLPCEKCYDLDNDKRQTRRGVGRIME